MTRSRRTWWTVGLAFVTSQGLAVAGWVLATVVTRHLVGDHFRPPQYHGFLGWTSWDGGFYRLIAEHGYLASSPQSIRFFPLYPILARPVSLLFGGNTDLALFVIAKVAVVVAMFAIHRLMTEECRSAPAADRAVWFWVLFPGAFVLAWAYSEPLLVALAAWGIWALRHRRWWTAAALGLAAGLCRPVGIAFAAAALVEVFRQRPFVRGSLPGRLAAVIAAPVGVAIFCAYAARRGFGFFAPFTSQDQFRGTQSPFERLWSLPNTLHGSEAFTAGLHVPFVILFLILLGFTFWKLPSSYGWFAAVVLIAALSAQNLNSIERYATSAFPLAMAAAVVLERRERLEPAVYAVAGALSIGLCALALTGAYVP